jgi:CDP-glycerol glycerophosphotransferase
MMRHILQAVAHRLIGIASWLAMRLLPARPFAVVHGWPDWEGNSLQVLKRLPLRYSGDVYWLINADDTATGLLPYEIEARVKRVHKNSLRAIYLSLVAELVFFTHGLVTAVNPPRSRLVVNLWHGDGPKQMNDVGRSSATVVLASTGLWAKYKAQVFQVPLTRIAVVGHPRIELLREAPSPDALGRLGLHPDAGRLVLWLPTWRQGLRAGHRRLTEAAPLSRDLRGHLSVPEGLQLVINPHPMEADDYSQWGATVVTDEDLRAAGVSLYQLMGAARALLSDASSAWVDYLSLDRPVGFFLPDYGTYGGQRGFNVPDLASILPGRLLKTPGEASDFLAQVANGTARPPSAHHEAMVTIGYCHADEPTDRLLDWLNRFDMSRGRRPLFH